jgi:hypothetical protein
MNKKTKRHTKHYKKRHTMRHKKRQSKRNLYRKRREFVALPGSKATMFFSSPNTKQSNKIHIVTNNNMLGNIIPGLRQYQI